ncbi:MAG: hypothetical protein ABJF11_05485 [Reichenbachiella sp.]|uniref:hypothetical protein n=1 Tax=Reichenbachiella sp. TaxID=2184521 RepID=UPI0032653D27
MNKEKKHLTNINWLILVLFFISTLCCCQPIASKDECRDQLNSLNLKIDSLNEVIRLEREISAREANKQRRLYKELQELKSK